MYRWVEQEKDQQTFSLFPPAANMERASNMTSLFDGQTLRAARTRFSSSIEY